MDFQLVAISLGDITWITLAFVLGVLVRFIGLPPLVGFLAAGFLLNIQGNVESEIMQKLSDLGITLLLFTIGLKLNVKTLIRPQVWAVTCLHTTAVVIFLSLAIYLMAIGGLWIFAELGLNQSLLLAFALSFSSTVFVVKILEENSALTSLHGRIAIGILLMQDVAAVAFLAVSTGKVPSWWALLLLLLIPLRHVLRNLLEKIGRGELLVLYGVLLALGGAEVFELVGIKGDLGALVLGVSIASHPRSEEMAHAMSPFKDLFLLGFFLSIGLSGSPSAGTLMAGIIMTPLILVKSGLLFALLSRFGLRARTSLLTTLKLSNYSEFGLIVVAISVSNGWLDNKWLIALSIALSLSFVLSAILNRLSDWLYSWQHELWNRFQQPTLIEDDELFDLGNSSVAIIGMGGVGTGAYDTMYSLHGKQVIGIDIDPVTASNQRASDRHVIRGDPTDPDFWDRVRASHTLELIMLALPREATSLAVLEQLRRISFEGKVAAIARFPDEVENLKAAGALAVFNMYAEAGAGFVGHVNNEILVLNDK